jgi:hypothetical protein
MGFLKEFTGYESIFEIRFQDRIKWWSLDGNRSKAIALDVSINHCLLAFGTGF